MHAMQTAQERIGARMRAARGDRRAMDFAASLKVNLSTIYRYEAGEVMPPVDRQEEIAALYGVPWAELFDPAEAVA